MRSFTLDTNCIIAVATERKEAAALRELARAHALGHADVAITAVSASERQKGDFYLDKYTDFRDRLENLGLGHLKEIPGIAYLDISYWDHALYPTQEMVAREEAIHRLLFPTTPYIWADFAAANGIAVSDTKGQRSKKWRNAFCDRQMYWAHDHAKRDIFVTSDKNFRRIKGHSDFPGAIILTPSEAVARI